MKLRGPLEKQHRDGRKQEVQGFIQRVGGLPHLLILPGEVVHSPRLLLRGVESAVWTAHVGGECSASLRGRPHTGDGDPRAG